MKATEKQIILALKHWVYDWQPKKLLSIYEKYPKRFSFLDKGKDGYYYRQIKVSKKIFDQLLSGQSIYPKKSLESWSKNEKINSDYAWRQKEDEFVITFKKKILFSQRVVYIPKNDLGMEKKDFNNEKELIAVSQVLNKKDIYRIEASPCYFKLSTKKEMSFSLDKFQKIRKNPLSLESHINIAKNIFEKDKKTIKSSEFWAEVQEYHKLDDGWILNYIFTPNLSGFIISDSLGKYRYTYKISKRKKS